MMLFCHGGSDIVNTRGARPLVPNRLVSTTDAGIVLLCIGWDQSGRQWWEKCCAAVADACRGMLGSADRHSEAIAVWLI